jgi:glucosamine-6-phosphate deaminase
VQIQIFDTAAHVADAAFDLFSKQIASKPTSVLGLATGGTPEPFYERCVAANQIGALTLGRVTTFNLDEYVGLDARHPNSYRTYMRDKLFEPTGLSDSQTHLPDGMADDLVAECERYELAIVEAGGIDLQLLGLGSDGHIAFNEPMSSLGSRTRVVALTAQTIADNSRYFKNEADVPKMAITMGIGTILHSRAILLIATGQSKAAAVHSMIEGPLAARVPATALQNHPNTTILLDEAAASELERVDYYRHAQQILSEI